MAAWTAQVKMQSTLLIFAFLGNSTVNASERVHDNMIGNGVRDWREVAKEIEETMEWAPPDIQQRFEASYPELYRPEGFGREEGFARAGERIYRGDPNYNAIYDVKGHTRDGVHLKKGVQDETRPRKTLEGPAVTTHIVDRLFPDNTSHLKLWQTTWREKQRAKWMALRKLTNDDSALYRTSTRDPNSMDLADLELNATELANTQAPTIGDPTLWALPQQTPETEKDAFHRFQANTILVQFAFFVALSSFMLAAMGLTKFYNIRKPERSLPEGLMHT